MKQYSIPVIIDEENSSLLQKISLNKTEYNEAWVQDICFKNPELLPISEIETMYSGMLPICKELSLKSGYVDLLYINEYGFPVIGECKLWRNPESRRKVIGQILDYAKDISNLGYEDFEKKCLRARKGKEKTLFEIIEEKYKDISENEFIDNLQKNMKMGRFLLCIIGDGIRENMEEMTDFINNSGNMNFTLSLIEIPLYKLPNEDRMVITPRIIAKTKEIERIIYKESNELPKVERNVNKEALSISEQVFYERLEENIGNDSIDRFKALLGNLQKEANIFLKLGRGKKLSLNLKSSDDIYNFASIQESGEVWFYGIVTKTEEIGDKEIGMDYLRELAKIMNADFNTKNKEWMWCVKKEDRYIIITEYLEKEKEWIELINNIIEKIRKREDE